MLTTTTVPSVAHSVRVRETVWNRLGMPRFGALADCKSYRVSAGSSEHRVVDGLRSAPIQ
jgi:hypothetical protein